MKTLPIELLVENRPALVIGGDDECRSKVERLLLARATVHVICDGAVHSEIEAHANRGALQLSRRSPTEDDVRGALVTFVGLEHRDLGSRLFDQAHHAGRLLCCLDHPSTSTFVNPAVADVAGLRVTLSSGGESPGLLRRLREDLVAALSDDRLGRFVETLGELRRSLPLGERRARMQRAVAGFALTAELRFPEWFEAGAAPPGSGPHEPPHG